MHSEKISLIDDALNTALSQTNTIIKNENTGFTLEEALTDFFKTELNTTSNIKTATVIKTTVGGGKTYKTVEKTIAAIKSRKIKTPVIYFCTNNNTSKEVVNFFNEIDDSINVVHLTGRSADNCKRFNIIADAYKKCAIIKNICNVADVNTNESGACEFAEHCKYKTMFRDINANMIADVYVVPFEYIKLNNIPENIRPELVIYDEGFFGKLITHCSLRFSNVCVPWNRGKRSDERYADLQEITAFMSNALRNKENIIDALIEKFSIDTVIKKLDNIITLRKNENSVTIKALKENRNKVKLNDFEADRRSNELAMFSAMLEAVKAKAGFESKIVNCNIMFKNEDIVGQFVEVSILRKLPYNATSLCLDASANEELYKTILSSTHNVHFPKIKKADENIRRVAIINRSFATTSLTNKDNTNTALAYRKSGEEVMSKIAEYEKDRNVLLCVTKTVKELIEKGEFLADFVDTVQPTLIHFGAVKGLNAFQSFDTVIQIGKNEVSSNDIYLMSKSLVDFQTALKMNENTAAVKREKRTIYTTSNEQAQFTSIAYEERESKLLHEYLRDEETWQVEGRLRSAQRPDADLRSYIISDAISDKAVFNNIYNCSDLLSSNTMSILCEDANLFDCVSIKAYSEQTNAKRSAAQKYLANHGFTTMSCPVGWSVYEAKEVNKGGRWSVVYAKHQDNIETEIENVMKHYAHVASISSKNVEVRSEK